MRTHLQHPLRFAHRLNQLPDFVQRVAHRFLEVHVLAGIHGFEGHLGVPVVRSGDNHRVHVLAGDDFPVIQGPVALVEFLVRGHALLVNVGDGHDLRIADLLADFREGAPDIAATAAHANHTDINAIIRADDAPGTRFAGVRL